MSLCVGRQEVQKFQQIYPEYKARKWDTIKAKIFNKINKNIKSASRKLDEYN